VNPKLKQLSEETSGSICHYPRTAGHDLVEQFDHFTGRDRAGIATLPLGEDVMLENSLDVCRVPPVGFDVTFEELVHEKLDAVWIPWQTGGGRDARGWAAWRSRSSRVNATLKDAAVLPGSLSGMTQTVIFRERAQRETHSLLAPFITEEPRLRAIRFDTQRKPTALRVTYIALTAPRLQALNPRRGEPCLPRKGS